MCRFFAYMSKDEDCLLEDVLIVPKHSLVKQVNDHYLPKLVHYAPDNPLEKDIAKRNLALNTDGLGIAWYTSTQADFNKKIRGQRPAVYRTVSPAVHDMNLRSVCANTHARTLFGHIRASSGAPVAEVNNHPFVFGRHSFMHNGAVPDFVLIRREICTLLDKDVYSNVFGSTDSEHVAALYMTILTKGQDKSSWESEYTADQMAFALHMAVVTIIETQQKVLGKAAKPNSLNLCVTDGVKLVAYRFRNHKTEQPPTLYWSTTAGITMNRKYPGHPDGPVEKESSIKAVAEAHSDHVIIASEPSTYKEEEWNLIGKNQCLLYQSDGSLTVKDIPFDDKWNADDGDVALED